MSGPTRSVAASSAVDSRAPLRSSHRSTPDLLSAAGASPPCAANAAAAERSPSLKSLSGLAAFDIPSFDLVSEFEKSFGSTTTAITTTTTAETLPTRPATATEPTVRFGLQDERGGERESTAAGVTVVGGHHRRRSKSMIDRPSSWLPSARLSPGVRATHDLHSGRLDRQDVAAPPDANSVAKPLERSSTVDSLADFAKRSWISKSRSPSPSSHGKPEKPRAVARSASAEVPGTSKTTGNPQAQADGGAAAGAPSATESSSSASRALSRASLYLTKIKQRPQSVFSRSSPPLSLRSRAARVSTSPGETHLGVPPAPSPATPASATPTLSAAPSSPAPAKNAAHNTSSSASRASSQRAPSVDTELDTDTATASSASENASQSTTETNVTMPHPTSRDPLWATFRTLDMEFSRLAGKNSTAARMSVIRSILLPFLRSTALHPSNSNRAVLTPEDTDRRATILNKWWNGLLAMLTGGSPKPPSALGPNMAALGVQFPVLQPVAGVDRPTLLEAATMIMMRPEWRLYTSSFQPLAERRPQEKVRARSGTQSTVASDADSLLAESAEHNVRTMFVANLTTQMALVVDKLSLRHAPLSLVNWCGKACAYAFFFVPGVADVLVRLWGLNADLLRRVADEFALPRRSRGESEDIVALFPPHLHKLGWSSVKTLADKLRLATKLPLLLAKIHWHGPWVSRWRGGDTDLVFIFCKYFYILAQQFIPEGLPLVEKARAPAFVLVHAQLLSVLDSTIHRQASLDAMLGPPLSDALHGADAALPAPQIPSNLLKEMDENRLVVLLKDMLSEHSIGVTPEIKHTFAEAFVALAKAGTKRTPRFEHASCFMLCDFLEQALVALDTFQNTVNNSVATSPAEATASPSGYFEIRRPSWPVSYVDWAFWLDVAKMMMDSNNTMSEIRVMSFIFSIWDAITASPAQKEALCLDWLLTEQVFAKFFNHWCPMVRAYYMRLLCWRICRDSGSANEVDIKIFLVASERLKTVWSHYLWLKQDAEAKGRMLPSTAPCYPAPGKRFLIIRTEVQQPQPSMRVGFDSFPSPFTTPDPAVEHRATAVGGDDSGSGNGQGDGNMSFKKRWSLLGKILPFASSQASQTSDAKRTWEEQLEQARRETAASRKSRSGGQPDPFQQSPPPTPPKQGPSAAVTSSSDSASSTGSASTFDGTTFVFRFTLTWQTGPHGGPVPFGPPRDRMLTRPRLPAPAQARVSARCSGQNGGDHGGSVFRSDSPPPVSPGLPPETRRVSGLLQTGLISEARNARPLSAQSETLRPPVGKSNDRRPSLTLNLPSIRFGDDWATDDDRLDGQSPVKASGGSGGADRTPSRGRSPGPEPAPTAPGIRPERPTGVYAAGAVYTGRALAEWSIVVGECNSFVDRRRDEGVLGLSDIEVPSLGVEGVGLRARG